MALRNRGSSTFYFLTNHGADRYKVIALDTTPLDRGVADLSKAQTIIAESRFPLSSASLFGDRIYAEYLEDCVSKVKVFKRSTASANVASPGAAAKAEHAWAEAETLNLPGMGSISGFHGKRQDPVVFFTYESFTRPAEYYLYDFSKGDFRIFRSPKRIFDDQDLVVTQVFYESHDRTTIPMFLVHRKDLKRDASHPVLLYGYGGFNISLTPRFSPMTAVWLKQGGIYAVANIRGGGEYGEEWHRQGMKRAKINVFLDFERAAEHLIRSGYTTAERLAIHGGSNGGLLVGAVINRRPNLFRAALAEVGVFDMLRYNKFTIGWAWEEEYGKSENAEDFPILLAYSPLHNVKAQAYPASMIMTSDHDDRVVPAHSFKFVAELQSKQRGPHPVLLRLQSKGGHGGTVTTSERVAKQADSLAFLMDQLRMP